MNPSITSLKDCAHCATRGRSVFSEVCSCDLETISTTKRDRVYDRGDMIFFAGDSAVGLYCLNKGNVKVYKVGKDGREQTVRLSQPGDIFGYRAILTGTSYESYAVAMDHVELCYIPKETFHGLLTTNQPFAARMLQLLAGELQATESRLVEIAQRPIRDRLAEALLLLRQRYGFLEDGQTLGIRLTRIELGNILGTAPESISRMLSKFQQEKMVEVKGRSIKLLDLDALADAAGVED